MTEGVEFYCDYLIKLGVGDPYRLEHIKQHYIQHNSLWSADEKYLEHLKKKYIHNVENPPNTPKTDFPTADKIELTSDDSSPKKIHCWKCGGKNDGSAKFCNHCAHPLREVGVEKKLVSKKTIESASTFGSSKKKIIIIAAITFCVIIIGGGAAMYGGNIDFGKSTPITQKTTITPTVTPTEGQINSKCGPGTVFDSDANTCVLADETNTESNSKCGPGTAYDPESNSCVLI